MEIVFTAPAGGPTERLQGTLGHYGITDRRCRGGFRRSVIFHVAAFRLFLRGSVAQADLVLVRTDLHDLEFVIASGIEQPALPRAGARRHNLLLIALGTPLIDLGNVAETFNAVRNFDERAKRRDPRNSSANQVANLVFLKPARPDIVDLLDAERYAARRRIDLQHFGFDRVALFVNIGGILHAPGPGNIAHVDQAVETFLDFQERAEFGQVPDLSADHRANWIFLGELLPRVRLGLLHSQRNTPFVRIDAEYGYFNVIADFHYF